MNDSDYKIQAGFVWRKMSDPPEVMWQVVAKLSELGEQPIGNPAGRASVRKVADELRQLAFDASNPLGASPVSVLPSWLLDRAEALDLAVGQD